MIVVGKPVRARRQRGFTLIELTIAISLVAAISTGMLLAMRNGLLTLERTQARLDENRRALAIDRLVRRQLGGVIPADGRCGQNVRPIFRGTPTRLLMVTTYSRSAGARGMAVVAEYVVAQNSDGTFRLMVKEIPFAGWNSTRGLCNADGRFLELDTTFNDVPENWFVVADRLASAGFAYQFGSALRGQVPTWRPIWDLPDLPMGIRIEMVPVAPETERIPIGSVTVPLHITRQGGENYEDLPQ